MIRYLTLALMLVLAGCSLLPGTEANLERDARRALETSLYDAESARFAELRKVGSGSNETICGLVNAKNRIGAFVGFRRFIHLTDGSLTVVEPLAGSGSSDHERAVQAGFESAWPGCETAR